MLQNGAIPRFLGEENLQEIFSIFEPTQRMLQLRNGLAELGIYQVVILKERCTVCYKMS